VSIVDALAKLPTVARHFQVDDYPSAQRLVKDTIKELEATKPRRIPGISKIYQLVRRLPFRGACRLHARRLRGIRASRARVDGGAQHAPIEAVSDRRDMGELSTWLAMAIARQGRLAKPRR